MKFSLSFFSNLLPHDIFAEKYDFLFRLVRYAEDHNYHGVWVPERHFHPFGGLFPSPAVMASAMAQDTNRLRLYAGSVVLPLHSPVLVAEEWAMIDQLSKGRVSVSFASGWNEKEFSRLGQRFDDRRQRMWDGIQQIKQLWQDEVEEYTLYPKPYQKEIPIYITAIGGLETCYQAGLHGYHLLTNFVINDMKHLQEKIDHYRRGLRDGGHEWERKDIALMLHTYIANSQAEVETVAKDPFFLYQDSFLNLMNNPIYATEREKRIARTYTFNKFSPDYSLLGTMETCRKLIHDVKRMGVTQIAALVDFGIDEPNMIASLDRLTALAGEWDA